MRYSQQVKLSVLTLFVILGVLMLLAGRLGERRVAAKPDGPDPGFTHAPGEKDCTECHLPDGAPPGTVTINAPLSYVPGQTYAVTVNVLNNDPTRRRWGFQLTAIDDTGARAGTLTASADGTTQIKTGTIGSPARQYAEHTFAGIHEGQAGGASWTFGWTAPSENVGPVEFYAAGNAANGDNSSGGDSINYTFAAAQPAASASDFTITVTPAAQNILPGAAGAYTVTVTPAGGFTGSVALSVAGAPAGTTATLNPTAVQITDATPRAATLNVTNSASVPLGSFTLTVTGQSGSLTHAAAAALVTGPTMTDANLTVRQVVAGLDQPITLAFIGHNDLLVLEKASGKVRRVTNGALGATVLDLAVNSNSERGLLGIALHPQFPANPRVYLYWTESSTGADSAAVDDVPQSPPLGNRVDSYLWNGSTLAFERNLIKLRAYQADEPTHRGNHDGGVIRFGPDGKLYVVIGDNGRRGMLQNLQFGPSQSPQGPPVADDQFGGPEPDDAHLTGVILRLNDDGTTPADNPFFNAQTNLTGQAATNVKKVFAYGIRNSFGLAFDPLSGQLWEQENGDDAFDEINRIAAGFDGGWIQLMGPSSRVGEFKQIEVARGDSLQQARWPPHLLADTPAEALARLFLLPGARYTEPELSWKYALAPAAIGFVKGRALGAQYEGDMFVGASRTTLLNGFLFRLKLTPDRRTLSLTDARLADRVADNLDKFDLTESESLVAGRDFGVVTDIQTGTDGNVYAVSLSNGTIYSVSAARQNTIQFSTAAYTSQEGNLNRATVTVTRTGDVSAPAAVEYMTVDDPAAVGCFDTTNNHGAAYARCDYATTLDTLSFAAGETSKTFDVPLIDDAYVEGDETVALRLLNPTAAALGAQAAATLTIRDNDTTQGPNPVFSSPFFVRQQYLDFLSREPDPDGFQAWLRVLNSCPDVNNTDPNSASAGCDRITVSSAFFGSQEFRLKGFFVFLFYKTAFGRDALPTYDQIVADMRAVTGATAAEVFQKRAAFADSFAARYAFRQLYDEKTDAAYVAALLARYGVTQITTPDPQQPDGDTFVTLTQSALVNQLAAGTLTRAQVLRAVVQSREAEAAEFNGAFVAMQYYGYLRRTPEAAGYNDWLNYLSAHPNDFRTMVNGFMNSPEYRLRFGAPDTPAPAYFVFDGPPHPETFTIKLDDPAQIARARSLVGQSKIVAGVIIKQPATYNRPWSFQLAPSSITFVDVATEVCDARILYVEQHLAEVGGAFLPGNRWCPWNARILREVPPP
ncbi:MAG TPA: PQQ-dependent sugar dehydrogenase [Pyrinomonadaceae bacterium]|jgi:glucose/arabinose dehydrogenase